MAKALVGPWLRVDLYKLTNLSFDVGEEAADFAWESREIASRIEARPKN